MGNHTENVVFKESYESHENLLHESNICSIVSQHGKQIFFFFIQTSTDFDIEFNGKPHRKIHYRLQTEFACK